MKGKLLKSPLGSPEIAQEQHQGLFSIMPHTLHHDCGTSHPWEHSVDESITAQFSFTVRSFKTAVAKKKKIKK